jgi:hypothetical protein
MGLVVVGQAELTLNSCNFVANKRARGISLQPFLVFESL